MLGKKIRAMLELLIGHTAVCPKCARKGSSYFKPIIKSGSHTRSAAFGGIGNLVVFGHRRKKPENENTVPVGR